MLSLEQETGQASPPGLSVAQDPGQVSISFWGVYPEV